MIVVCACFRITRLINIKNNTRCSNKKDLCEKNKLTAVRIYGSMGKCHFLLVNREAV